MGRKPTRRQFLQSSAVVTTGLAAGCSGNGETTTDDSGSTEVTETTTGGSLSKTEFNILLTYQPEMVYSPVLAADRLGYFEDVGLNVNIEYSFGLNPMQVLTSDEFDVIVDNHISTVTGKARGVPVETVLTTIGNTPQTFASLSEKDITSVGDIPGNTLGLQNAPDVQAYTDEIFGNQLSESQRGNIEEAFIGYAVNNLLADNVDVMTLYPTNADFASLEVTGTEFNTINMMDFIDVSGNAALTSTSTLENNRPALVEYTRAHAKGLNDVLDPSNKDNIAEMIVDVLNDYDLSDVHIEGADPMEVQRLCFEKFLEFRPIDSWDTYGAGYNNPEYVGNAQQLLANIGNISEPAMVDQDELVNNELINEVYDDNGELIW
jgi:ABC-type nitrate/sulfonate/bicarbonate transport system substrate-binding protein